MKTSAVPVHLARQLIVASEPLSYGICRSKVSSSSKGSSNETGAQTALLALTAALFLGGASPDSATSLTVQSVIVAGILRDN